ncbi:MAG: peptide chain release factor-like protein [Myxococcota bacterium]|nr:peptide chain release factor-like protein [Myxococcota bacterium]
MRFTTDRDVLEKEVQVQTYRSGGPGGQHRNKTDTAVRLHHPPSGVTVTAAERRSQSMNRELAFERLIERLEKLNYRPKKRRPTKPTRASKRRRVDAKKRRGAVKRGRGRVGADD